MEFFTFESVYPAVDWTIVRVVSNWIFLLALAYYLLTNLQWYSYKIFRVLFRHHKWRWHIYHFFFPIVLFVYAGDIFYLYFYIFYLPFLIYWAKHLDKPLVLTNRIGRFLFIYIALLLFGEILHYGFSSPIKSNTFYLLPLILTILISNATEMILLWQYAKVAREKILNLQKLKVIAITGSFGKTSLKNFLAQILSEKLQVYATPRSVNTFAGIVSDINTNLPDFSEIYVVEAGARAPGDILQIARLVSPQYGIVGKIGSAHMEYFKTLETIRDTKFELAQSERLERLYSYKDNEIPEGISAVPFPSKMRNVVATLDGLRFELEIDNKFYAFESEILGLFNAQNIAGAIKVAYDLGMDIGTIQKEVKKLAPVPHRLNRVNANGKIILDDSFNGNLEGMLEAIRLASLHKGRKIIITPGLVESTKEENIHLAQTIDKHFAIAIITGELNSALLSENITTASKIILKEKRALESVLKASTQVGDLILFANDAPSYI